MSVSSERTEALGGSLTATIEAVYMAVIVHGRRDEIDRFFTSDYVADVTGGDLVGQRRDRERDPALPERVRRPVGRRRDPHRGSLGIGGALAAVLFAFAGTQGAFVVAGALLPVALALGWRAGPRHFAGTRRRG